MEEEVLVKVENISKKFCKSLKRSLWYGMHDIAHEFTGHKGGDELRKDEFWALKDISFELKRGECLGLIGHNGAGKSTLLKTLNGLIKPDKGKITMKGRVCALIELGAGFNPILTGRENIYINASVLGLTKKEIDAKFDDIVDFAEIGEFIDTPFQNYSSGMKIRLGFAVAIQMEPDVLLVDEVLAVGDLGFVIKCLNRISEILPLTATIFVSHNMPMISRICTRIIYFVDGLISFVGNDIPQGIEHYSSSFKIAEMQDQGSGEIQLEEISLRKTVNDQYILHNYIHENGDSLNFLIKLKIKQKTPAFFLSIIIFNQKLIEAVSCFSRENSEQFNSNSDDFSVNLSIPALYLNRGCHTITIVATDAITSKMLCRTTNAISFFVRSKFQGWATCILPGKWEKLTNIEQNGS